MTVDYRIAAIPTEYRSRIYRSRLEARWAAFFDLAGWSAEYEPADLGLWSPDFLLRGANGPILVEVKPLTSFDADVARKMHNAAVYSEFRGELLLLGTSPFNEMLGWLCDGMGRHEGISGPHDTFADAPFAVYEQQPGSILVDFCHSEQGYSGRITGLYDGGCWGAGAGDARDVAHGLWAKATNLVQWQADGSRPHA